VPNIGVEPLTPVQWSQGAQHWSRTNDHMEANLLANICQSMMTWQVGILFCEMAPKPGRPLLQEIVFHNSVIPCHAGLPLLLHGVMHALAAGIGTHPGFGTHPGSGGPPSIRM
jgi:hypothetical protein